VGISRRTRDFQGVVERGEILLLDFHAFHHSDISIARSDAFFAILTGICW
jgi:hypothetical protein